MTLLPKGAWIGRLRFQEPAGTDATSATVAPHSEPEPVDPKEEQARRLAAQATELLSESPGCEQLEGGYAMNGGRYQRDPVYIVTGPDDHYHATGQRFHGRCVVYATEYADRFVTAVRRMANNNGVDPTADPNYPPHLAELLDIARAEWGAAAQRAEQARRDLDTAEADMAAAEATQRDIRDRRYPEYLAAVEAQRVAAAEEAAEERARAEEHARQVADVEVAAATQGLRLLAVESLDYSVPTLAGEPPARVTEWYLVGPATHPEITAHLVGGEYVLADGTPRKNPKPRQVDDEQFVVPWTPRDLDGIAAWLRGRTVEK